MRNPAPHGPLLLQMSARCLCAMAWVLSLSDDANAAEPPVDFNRDVLPIFAERCLT